MYMKIYNLYKKLDIKTYILKILLIIEKSRRVKNYSLCIEIM